jgi:hypothetical protein
MHERLDPIRACVESLHDAVEMEEPHWAFHLGEVHDAAKAMVAFTRLRKRIDSAAGRLDEHIKKCNKRVQDAIENGEYPESVKIDGAAVFRSKQVWASPLDGDHARLTAVLEDLGLREYLPKTVNSQSLSGYIRGELDENEELPLEQRVESIDPRLREVLKITEKATVKINGA